MKCINGNLSNSLLYMWNSCQRVSCKLYTQYNVSFSSDNTERSKNGLGDVEPFGGSVELRETFHDVLRSPCGVLEWEVLQKSSEVLEKSHEVLRSPGRSLSEKSVVDCCWRSTSWNKLVYHHNKAEKNSGSQNNNRKHLSLSFFFHEPGIVLCRCLMSASLAHRRETIEPGPPRYAAFICFGGVTKSRDRAACMLSNITWQSYPRVSYKRELQSKNGLKLFCVLD